MKFAIRCILTLVVSGMALATEQIPDELLYEGQTLALSTGWGHPSPLETYYYQNGIALPFVWTSTANWRGHVAVWQVADSNLYLTEIQIEHYEPNEVNPNEYDYFYGIHDPNEYGVESKCCPPLESGAVIADWFSGVIECYGEHQGEFASYYFQVRHGQVVETQVINGETFDILYSAKPGDPLTVDLMAKLRMLYLNENYITYYFRLDDDEIEIAGQRSRLSAWAGQLSPFLGYYGNDHLNWPYNWENLSKSGAPHCHWLIEDSNLLLAGLDLHSGLSFYSIDVEPLDLVTVFDDKVVEGVVHADWVSGVYQVKHGYEKKESAGWPGLFFTNYIVTGYTYLRIVDGKMVDRYDVPDGFDPWNLPEEIDPGLSRIIADYELPTIQLSP